MVVEDDALLCDLPRHKPARAVQAGFAGRVFVRAGSRAILPSPTPSTCSFTDLRLPDPRRPRKLSGRCERAISGRASFVLTANVDATLPAELVALGVAGFVDNGRTARACGARRRARARGRDVFLRRRDADRSSLAVRAKKRLVEPRRAQRARARCRALVASGLSSKEIARQLDLSTRTVENYRANLMQKIGVRDTRGARALVSRAWARLNGLPAATIGSSKAEVAPSPGTESTIIWPPCNAISSRAIDSPRPVDDSPPVGCALRVWNGAKTRHSPPAPARVGVLHRDARRALGAGGRPPANGAGGGVNLIALSSRLSITCRNRAGSPDTRASSAVGSTTQVSACRLARAGGRTPDAGADDGRERQRRLLEFDRPVSSALTSSRSRMSFQHPPALAGNQVRRLGGRGRVARVAPQQIRAADERGHGRLEVVRDDADQPRLERIRALRALLGRAGLVEHTPLGREFQPLAADERAHRDGAQHEQPRERVALPAAAWASSASFMAWSRFRRSISCWRRRHRSARRALRSSGANARRRSPR